MRQEKTRGNVSEHPSDHTRIWSELSGDCFSTFFITEMHHREQKFTCFKFDFEIASGIRNATGAEQKDAQAERNPNTTQQQEIHRISELHIAGTGSGKRNVPNGNKLCLFLFFSWSFLV